MELDDLQIFLEVVRRGTLTGASETAHLSQPAISRRLSRLERELRAPLFERAGRRLRLTEAGAQLVIRAEAILGQVTELTATMAAYGAGASGHLRIGATVTACLYLLPPVFVAFRERHPEFPLLLRNDRSARVADLVHEGRVDIGIASVLTPREDVRVIPWQELELTLIRPRTVQRVSGGERETMRRDGDTDTMRRFSSSPDISIPPLLTRRPDIGTELTQMPMVLPSAGTLRTLTESLFARCEVAPTVVAECDSLEVVRALVAAGFGQGLVPRACVPEDGPPVAVVPLTETVPALPVAALVRRTRPTPRPVAAFLEALGLR
jgi:DNA-binding transcriptional LysR family regulator